MRVKILKEQKFYSIVDLKNIFEIDEMRTREILKALSLMNIVKTINKNSSDVELEELLETDRLIELEKQIDSELYQFRYVGLISIDNACLIIYPKYMKNYKEDSLNNYEYLRLLISVIKKYKYRKQNASYDSTLNSMNFNLISMGLELFSNYYENGLYRNDKDIIELNGDGGILWEKTINESPIYFSNNTPLYLDLYTSNSVDNMNDYFKRLHAVILTEISFRLKDVFTILNIQGVNLTTETLESFGNAKHVINNINKELSNQFITSRQNILQLLKKYLENKESFKTNHLVGFIGTTSFNQVWEDVCAVVMGNSLEKTIVELGLNIDGNEKQSTLLKDMISKPVWNHKKSHRKHYAKHTLIPDIIVIDNKELSVYDAKYYNIELNENTLGGQPGIADITKQYLYELAFKKIAEENNLYIKKNAFLMPIYGNEVLQLGDVSLDIFQSLEDIKIKKIGVKLLPTEKLYLEYLSK